MRLLLRIVGIGKELEVAVGVMEGEAPLEMLEVGVDDEVTLAVPVLVEVEVGVDVVVGVRELDRLELEDGLGVIDGEAPFERLDVGETVMVEEADNVDEGVGKRVTVPVGVGVGVTDAESDPERALLEVRGTVGVLLTLAPNVRLDVGETVIVGEADNVDEGVGEGVVVCFGVTDAESEHEGVFLEVRETV